MYLINRGRIGSRSEREYIDAERAARQYRRLANSIYDFKYDDDEDDDCVKRDEEIQASNLYSGGYDDDQKVKDNTPRVYDGEISSKIAPVPDQVVSLAINDDSSEKENLLDQSHDIGRAESLASSRRSSVSSAAVSVTPRANGKNSFKYKCCSICLADFTKGDNVKVLPNCGHTFHGDCLE